MKEYWVVVFEGGYSVAVPEVKGEGRDSIIMKARKLQSEINRYNFAGRRASGARVIKMYKTRITEI